MPQRQGSLQAYAASNMQSAVYASVRAGYFKYFGAKAALAVGNFGPVQAGVGGGGANAGAGEIVLEGVVGSYLDLTNFYTVLQDMRVELSSTEDDESIYVVVGTTTCDHIDIVTEDMSTWDFSARVGFGNVAVRVFHFLLALQTNVQQNCAIMHALFTPGHRD